MTYDNLNDFFDELFETLFSRYELYLEISMRKNEFIFNLVQILHYKCYKINFKCGELYTKSPDWIKNKEATISSKNEDDKCFQYEATVGINHEEIKRDPQRISQIRLFINKYNWDRIKYPSKIDDFKTFEKNNINLSCIKEMPICLAYISKIKSGCEKQIIFLIIPKEEKNLYYLAVKKL